MKHTPKRPAHHWVITTVDGVETGKCRICKATRIFDPERTRLEMLKKNAVSK